MRVHAAIFREGQRLAQIESVSLQQLRADEVLVRVVGCGICHSDLTCRDGKVPVGFPLILGHEGSGVVERVGESVRKVAPGDHVVLSFNYCGNCPSCRSGKPCYCHNFYQANLIGRRLDGSSALQAGSESIGAHFFGQSSFATHSVANERNVVKVRKDVPLELLGPLGCGVQTGAGTVMNVLKPNAGEVIAVFGAGGVGLSAVMAARIVGCGTVIVIEPNAERRALALECGAHIVIDPFAEPDLSARLTADSKGSLLHVIDTTGIPDVLRAAAQALAPRGQLALLTVNSPGAELGLPLQLVLSKGLVIRGICEGESIADDFIPELVDLIAEGRFGLARLVRYYDFEDIDRALDDQAALRTVKPILRMPR